jgi:hypothetical protein
MSEWVDIPLALQSSEIEANDSNDFAAFRYASDANLINFRAEENPPGHRSPFRIASTPGWVAMSDQPAGSGRFRGFCVRDDGTMFIVRGTTIYYSTGGAWTAVPVGTMPGTAPCRMVDSDTHVVCVDGTNARAITTAESFACSRGNFSDVTYQDGYTIFTETGSNSLYVSAIDDPTTINALDFTTADALAGDCVGVMSDHREVFVFKSHSIEHYYNAGGSGFPFQRSSPGLIERGCASNKTIAKYDNSIFWVGDDRRVYMMRGYQPTQISTPWVDGVLADQGSFLTVNGSAFSWRGRPFYVLSGVSVTNSPISTSSFVYDVKTGLWHRLDSEADSDTWHSSIFIENNSSSGTRSVFVFGNGNSTGNVYFLSETTVTENGVRPTRTITLPQISFGGQRVVMHELYIDVARITQESGHGSVTLKWDDGIAGSTYTTGTAATTYYARRIRWHRLGAFFQRTIRIVFADLNEPIAIIAARARVSVGE